MNKLCLCGCGGEVSSEKVNFIHGHYRRGKLHSAATKLLISSSCLGKIVSKEIREKLSKYSPWCKGKTLSEETRNKISKNHRRPMLGKIVSKETRKKLGRYPPWNKGKKYSKKECLNLQGINLGRKQSEATRLKHRISKIKYVEKQRLNGNRGYPTIGKLEQECLDQFEKYSQYKIIRNDPSFSRSIGRFPDGHIQELKLFIQFDEYHHFTDFNCIQYKQDDIDCTLQLASLGYIVYRVSEKSWKDNKEKVIQEFLTLIKA